MPALRLSIPRRPTDNAICTVCVDVVPRTPRRWDSRRDMCRLCAMNTAEAEAQHRARTLAIREEDQERQRLGLTIRVPPRKHRICTLCNEDFVVPLTDDPAHPSARCRPCQKCEKCLRCKKVKKRKRFRKENAHNSLYKTCCDCREKAATRAYQLRLQAESQGTCMRDSMLCPAFLRICVLSFRCKTRRTLLCEWQTSGFTGTMPRRKW